MVNFCGIIKAVSSAASGLLSSSCYDAVGAGFWVTCCLFASVSCYVVLVFSGAIIVVCSVMMSQVIACPSYRIK